MFAAGTQVNAECRILNAELGEIVAGVVTSTVTFDEKKLEALEKEFAATPALLTEAVRRGVNRTAFWARGKTAKTVTGKINIKREDIVGTDTNRAHRFGDIGVRQAQQGQTTARVTVTGNRIPLFRFGGSPTSTPTRRGVSYRIERGGARKRITQNAFFVRMKSGHEGLFYRERTGETRTLKSGVTKTFGAVRRFPIWELMGPSIPQVAEDSPEFKQMLEVDAGAELEKNIGHNVEFLLRNNRQAPDNGTGDENV